MIELSETKTMWTRAGRLLTAFRRSRDGVAAVFFALTLVPIVGAAGAAVDVSRAYLVKQRLNMALDAAGLAVGAAQTTDRKVLEKTMKSYFDANYPASEVGIPAKPIMKISGKTITIMAKASVDTTLMRAVGLSQIEVAAETQIVKETKGIEVALVLDNTGSMSGSKLRSLQSASKEFVNILFGEQTKGDKLSVAVVPFTGAVNIGPRMAKYTLPQTETTWVEEEREEEVCTKKYKKKKKKYVTKCKTEKTKEWVEKTVELSYKPDVWRGCVEARADGLDETDEYKDQDKYRWTRYYWKAHNSANNWPTTSGNRGQYRGPNKQCPVELLPLEASKSKILAKIDQMEANGVTHINVGAVWGWRVLSPGEPFTQGVPYHNKDFKKIMVLMTDGENFISSSSGNYSAYGYLSDGRLKTTNSTAARNQLDNRLDKVCKNAKKDGIIIYTITFQLYSNSIRSLMRRCATDHTKYFDSPSNDQLRKTFEAIGAELSNLRIGS